MNKCFSEKESLDRLANRAVKYVDTKLAQTTRTRRQILHQIIKEQTKNKSQLYFSIFVLLSLLPYTRSQEQEDKVVKIIAEKIAQFEHESDYLAWEFILLKSQTSFMQGEYFEVIDAICWTLKYNFDLCQDEEEVKATRSYFVILIAYKVDFFFNRNFYKSLHLLKIA